MVKRKNDKRYIRRLPKETLYICSSLLRVKPYNIHSMEEKAFYHCMRVREALNKEPIGEIGDCAFFNCSILKRIDLLISMSYWKVCVQGM